jgi:hypothetical protein
MLRFLFAFLISGVTLTAAPHQEGVQFAVTTDTARHFYAQVDTTMGAVDIFEFNLLPGETFSRIVPAQGPGAATVRVWASDDGVGPAATQVVRLPGAQLFLPLLLRT